MNGTQNWDMSIVYEGGSSNEAFKGDLEQLFTEARSLKARSDSLPDPSEVETWGGLLVDLYDTNLRLHEIWTWIHCLTSQNTLDKAAEVAEERLRDCSSILSLARIPLDDLLAFGSEEQFEALVSLPSLSPIRGGLENIRKSAQTLLPKEQQAICEALSNDGLRAWGALYTTRSGEVTVKIDGEELSAAQAFNRVSLSRDADERKRIFDAVGDAWKLDRDLWAKILNHITGTRITLNELRGIDTLDEPITNCRMEEASVNAMMEAIASVRAPMTRFLELKARALGKDRLGYQDLRAPVGEFRMSHSWENSKSFILKHFKENSRPLYDLSVRAFEERWIEAEDRAHKRQGGWCANLPISEQSRIFMTHSGGINSTITLAHELGHAYHNEATKGIHPAMRDYPMTLAETASTFAENLMRDAALEAAEDDKEKLAILNARLSSAVAYLMDIPARFAFEKRLYDLRRKGPLDPDTLDEVTVEIQREWFGDALESWNPTFWCSKLHFYIASISFYNFPYSFGFLFSQLVYDQVRADPEAWKERYDELLRDTGWRTAEDIASTHLGLDLRDPEAWKSALKPVYSDLEAFEALLDKRD